MRYLIDLLYESGEHLRFYETCPDRAHILLMRFARDFAPGQAIVKMQAEETPLFR